jgi:hypothetical protein
MGRVLETSDPATLLASLARNIPGAIYRCALDRGWTMQLIGEETARGLNDLRDLARGIHPSLLAAGAAGNDVPRDLTSHDR